MSKYQYLATVIMVGACAHAAHAQQDNAAIDMENTAAQENCVIERVQLPDGRYSEVGRCVGDDETSDDDMFDRVTDNLEGAIAQSEQIRHEGMVKSGNYDEAKAAILAEAKKVAQMPEGAARDAKEQRLKSLAETFQSRFGNRGRINKSVKKVVRNSGNGAISTRRGSVDANGRITPAGSGGSAIGGVQPTPAGTPGRTPAGTPGRNETGGDDLARPQICPPICGDDDLAKPQPHREAEAKDGRRDKNRNGARRSSIGTRNPTPAGTPIGAPNPGDLSCPAVVDKPTCGPREKLKRGTNAAGCTVYQCVAHKRNKDPRGKRHPIGKPKPGDLACPAVALRCGANEVRRKAGTDAAGCAVYKCDAITPMPKPAPNPGDLACPAVVNKPTCGPRERLKRGENAAGCTTYKCVSMKRKPGFLGATTPNPAGTRNPKTDAKAKEGVREKRIERRQKRKEMRQKRKEIREKRKAIREKRKAMREKRQKRMERREKRKLREKRAKRREQRQARRQKEQQAKRRDGATGDGIRGNTREFVIDKMGGSRAARDYVNSVFGGGGAGGFVGGGGSGGGRGGAMGDGSRGGGASSSAGPAGADSGLGGARGGALGDGSRGSSAGPTGADSGLGGARGGALGDGSRGSSAGPTGADSGLGGARGGAMGDGSRGGGSDGGGSDGGGSDGGGSGGSGGAGDR